MNFSKLIIVTLGFFLFANSAVAAPAKSLGDLNVVKAPMTLPFHVQSGNKIFFARGTADLGLELWVTDGTAAGTSLIKDIVPGAGSSNPMMFVSTKIAGQYGAYFVADTAATGRELWVTDGTAVGTVMLKDIYPGNSSSIGTDLSNGLPIVSVPESPYVFFAADNGVNGNEFWVSDGTPAGTKMVADMNAGAPSSDPRDFKFMPAYPAGVFFSATTAATGEELFFGNDVSSVIVHNLNPGAADSKPGETFFTSSALVYPAETAATGRELWSSNLVTPTLLADTIPGSTSSFIASPMQISTDQIVYGSIGQVGATVSSSLMITNGTPAGTSAITSLDCLPGGLTPLIIGANLKVSDVVNGHALFPCYNLETSRTTLWVSDGTAGTTNILRDFVSAPTTYLSDSFSMQRGNGRIIFMANDGQKGLEPWTTDGTTAGTSLLMDLNPGEGGSIDQFVAIMGFLTAQRNATASIFPATVGNERKVYYSDGTASNTRAIFDDSDSKTTSSYPGKFASVGSKVVFTATDSSKGTEIFISNGKRSGTKLLKNLLKAGDSLPEGFQSVTSGLSVFSALHKTKGREIWVTDATKPGTKLLKDINPGSSDSSPQIFKGKVRKQVFFRADTVAHGSELWVTKGSRRTTKLLKDIRPGAEDSFANSFVVLGRKGLFTADDGTNGTELWVTNGTSAGTTLLKDIESGSASSSPYALTVAGNRVFFLAFTAAAGTELWVSDGTADGTKMVKDIRPGAISSGIGSDELVAVGENVFFVANDGVNGSELWRSDGTEAGTYFVQDLTPGAGSSFVRYIEAVSDSQVVFATSALGLGEELWTATNAPGSMTLLKDINVGAGTSSLYNTYSIPSRGLVVFSATDGVNGREPWVTNGTSAGTTMLADIATGADDSYPTEFFARGRNLYFSAETAATGAEPFVIKLP